MDYTRPFPIQGEYFTTHEKSTIPWWLAVVAYRHYVKLFGYDKSLEMLAGEGGFGRHELLMLIQKKPLSEWERE